MLAQAVLTASLTLLLAACSPDPPAPAPTPASSTPRAAVVGVPQDPALRTVRMNSGRALTYVQPETAAQILCQTVDKHRIERVLDDQVSLHPDPDTEAACAIDGTRTNLRLSLTHATTPFTSPTQISGRPALLLPDTPELTIRVALTDDARTPRPTTPARPLLDLTIIQSTNLDPPAQRELAIRLLHEAIPLLTLAGDPLPDIDPTGRIPYTPTPLIRGAQIIDLPQPLQALQLCTLLTNLPPPPTTPDPPPPKPPIDPIPTDSAQCTIPGPTPVTVALTPSLHPLSTYPTHVSGRPAR
ncbi:MAG TPA: hypothetical protein VFV67_26115, partial [Actinophytocola sp.]|nr:hypothetical protein [Actinophytocola sp.]